MSNQLEIFLKLCIRIGWIPRGIDVLSYDNWSISVDVNKIILACDAGTDYYSLNDLCSIESGFWQFVCDKGLHGKYITGIGSLIYNDYFWWVKESSIQPDKSYFILSNVKLPDEPTNN